MGIKNNSSTGFDFEPGRILAKKYQVESLLGAGWEGEVYRLTELSTGIERAGKFFYPQRNRHNRNLKFYAQKLHKLRNCPILIQYHTQEVIWNRGERISFLISEYVEGELLSDFLKRQPGKRLHAFQGVHLLHALAKGMEKIHQLREYHGDLHTDNIMIASHGLGFELKLIDMYWWGSARPENISADVCDLVRVFYDSLGGARTYQSQPAAVKEICCGLKKSLILKKFKTAGKLKSFLEMMSWD
ncbi:MAG: serine/threonine protein kinase [Bradymonadales bacterium]|nr:MAG: serine/threonine protein kinase [Bradymonadales bacterium]